VREMGLDDHSSGGIGRRVEVGGHAEGRGWELGSLAAPPDGFTGGWGTPASLSRTLTALRVTSTDWD
jgi:hypothetical protein